MATTTPSPARLSIDHIAMHAMCEAKAYIMYVLKTASERAKAADMGRAVARELVLESLPTGVFPPDEKIRLVIRRAFREININEKERYLMRLQGVLISLGRVMVESDLKIIGGALPVSWSYDGVIVDGVCDGIVLDQRRGYKHPLVVDLSLTRYAAQYNPILYTCDVVSSHFNPTTATVSPCVVTYRSRWFYSHTYYHPPLYASIAERAAAIIKEFSPFRFGWWCAGCEFNGTCYTLL